LPAAAAVPRIAAALDEPAGARWFRAPGRVNLMGDHTDYNDGFVLPIAIQLECVAAARPAADGRVRARSLEFPQTPVDVPADGTAEPAEAAVAWGRYVAALVVALRERGRPAAGVEVVLSSSVPAGSGLSSSAALEVACALALCDAAGAALPQEQLAAACRRAEQLATGVPSGIMDQLASLAGRAGHALLVDCRSLDVTPVAIPAGLAVLVVHSDISRTLERSAYADRRAACEALAARLGLRALRDATWEQVRDDPIGRHVVTENARVHETARALLADDRDALGRLFAASHASLRDDYRVSIAELDVLVEALVGAGALGARLTGAGFGGAVVALADEDRAVAILEDASARYRAETGREPTPMIAIASDGAGPFEPQL
jgi:galactokinase